MTKWKITPVSVSVHLKTDSPIFGECATRVSVDDEGAGAFIRLQQTHDSTEKGTISVEFEELVLIIQAAKELISKHSKE